MENPHVYFVLCEFKMYWRQDEDKKHSFLLWINGNMIDEKRI